MRQVFFGANASTEWNTQKLVKEVSNFEHHAIDIRNIDELEKLFSKYNTDIKLIVHTAAQPSHDWAAREPITDFTVNANGTLNMLEMTRLHAPEATFIFTSTNKVYGDTPNYLPLVELDKRWEIDESHPYFKEGIDEKMSIDRIDWKGDYVIGNCRWATSTQQARNTSKNVNLEFNGELKCVAEWAEVLTEKYGVEFKSSLIRSRIKRGWDVEKTLTTPIRKINNYFRSGDI
jgi:hypothetical protein